MEGEINGDIGQLELPELDPTIDPADLPDQPDLGQTIDEHSINDEVANFMQAVDMQLQSIDACLDFPNPYAAEVTTFCFSDYETWWDRMGLIFIAVTAFNCINIIRGRR
jgi:hypothetical protein